MSMACCNAKGCENNDLKGHCQWSRPKLVEIGQTNRVGERERYPTFACENFEERKPEEET